MPITTWWAHGKMKKEAALQAVSTSVVGVKISGIISWSGSVSKQN
jgi:hypothetical protein